MEEKITAVFVASIKHCLPELVNSSAIQLTIKSSSAAWQLTLSCDFPQKILKSCFLPDFHQSLTQECPNQLFEIYTETAVRAHQTQIAGYGLRGVKNVIAVASGKGGVGKSTVTAHLATCLSDSGAKVGILDADIYGPSIPLMMGVTTKPAVQGEYYLPIKAHGVQTMSIGYLSNVNQAIIWRGPMLAKALLQMINTTFWDELDYLLIDLPPGTGDIQLSLVQKIPLTGAIIVTTPQPVATVDAEKAIQMFQRMNINVFGIVENMAWHQCTACQHQDAIFGQQGALNLAEKYQVSALGQLPLLSFIRQSGDTGTPSNSQYLFQDIAKNLALKISKLPLNYGNKFPPIVSE